MKKFILSLLFLSNICLGTPQDTTLPGDLVIPTEKPAPFVPGDQVIPHIEISDIDINDMIRSAQQAMRKKIKETTGQEPTETTVSPIERSVKRQVSVTPQNLVKQASVGQEKKQTRTASPVSTNYVRPRDGLRIIHKNLKYLSNSSFQKTVTLPSGSTALGTMKMGIEASGDPKPLLVELDYTWLGPNEAFVEMKGCRLWVKVKGHQTTARLEGAAHEMTCRAANGQVFDLPIKAHLVDGEDEYLGIKGERIFRGKDTAMILDFLNGGLNAYGDAMAKFQTKTQVSDGETPIKSENVEGDETKYIAGKTISGSMGKMMNWFVDYYQSLSPTIAVGTGRKVFLAIEGTIQVPSILFGEKVSVEKMMDEIKKANTRSGMAN